MSDRSFLHPRHPPPPHGDPIDRGASESRLSIDAEEVSLQATITEGEDPAALPVGNVK